MQQISKIAVQNKQEFYSELAKMLQSLLEIERDWLANTANFSALLFSQLPEINWAGFYLLKADELVLGAFQGNPACVRIALGRGVCGTAAQKRKILVVPDVDNFVGHIACDSASRSEIVLPIILPNGELWGVLDIDSPIKERFDEADRNGIENLLKILIDFTEWS